MYVYYSNFSDETKFNEACDVGIKIIWLVIFFVRYLGILKTYPVIHKEKKFWKPTV